MNTVRVLIALMMTVLFSSAAMAGTVTIYHGGGVLAGTIDVGGIAVDQSGNATVYVVEDLTGGGEPCTPSAAIVSPTTISRSITEGGTASSQTVTIRDDCNNNLSYTAIVTSGGTWISAPSSGTGTMNVTFNASNLIEGSYTGTIDVTTTYSTRIVTVYLTVDPVGGGGEPPGTVTLTDGVALRDVTIGAGGTHYYKFTLPVGTSGVQISIYGLDNPGTNKDMIVSYGLLAPDPNGYPIGVYYTCDDNSDWWCTVFADSSNETIKIRSNVAPGTYYIMVHSTASKSDFYAILYSAF